MTFSAYGAADVVVPTSQSVASALESAAPKEPPVYPVFPGPSIESETPLDARQCRDVHRVAPSTTQKPSPQIIDTSNAAHQQKSSSQPRVIHQTALVDGRKAHPIGKEQITQRWLEMLHHRAALIPSEAPSETDSSGQTSTSHTPCASNTTKPLASDTSRPTGTTSTDQPASHDDSTTPILPDSDTITSSNRLAQRLANLLDDQRSIHFYRRLADRVATHQLMPRKSRDKVVDELLQKAGQLQRLRQPHGPIHRPAAVFVKWIQSL